MTWVNGLKGGLVVAFSVVGVLAGRAETLTWTGKGNDNKISTAANWNPVKTPVMGDRLVSDVVDLHFAAETIELTGEGLVFAPTARIYFDNTFTGSGKLTIDGSNVALIFDTKNLSYNGETIVYHGELKPNTSHVFGTGPVTFHQDSKTDPCINNSLSKQNLYFQNDINLYGNDTTGSWVAIKDTLRMTIAGSITADCDFTIQNSNRGTTVQGGISAPGRTVTLKHANSTTGDYQLKVEGAIDANVIVQAADKTESNGHYVQFEGVSTGVGNSLTIESGTNILTSAASWAGANIDVKSGAMLWLQGSGNLSTNAHLQVEQGGFVKIDEDVVACVRRLTVSGIRQKSGTYTKSNCSCIVGDGKLNVLPSGLVLIFR